MTGTGAHPSLVSYSLRSRVVGRPASSAEVRRMVEMCPANGASGRALQWLAHRTAGVCRAAFVRPVGAWPLPIAPSTWASVDAAVRASADLGPGSVIWHLPPPDQPQLKFGALFLGGHGHADVFARVLLAAPVPALTPAPPGPSGSAIGWPVRLADLRTDGVAVEVTTATPAGLHVPVHLGLDALLGLCDDVAGALSSGARPHDVPAGWQPMHGDIAHWNLRRYRNGEVMLLDWESAGWGPPHADLVRALMTAPDGQAMGRALPASIRRDSGEAATFWRSRLNASRTSDAPGWVSKAHAGQADNLAPLMGAR
jgi:hypothetical protein